MPPPCSPCPLWKLGPVADGCPAPSGLQRGVVVVGNALTILTRAAEITLGWELKKKILVSNYKPPVWKEHFVANLVPSKWLLFLQDKGKISDVLIIFLTPTAFLQAKQPWQGFICKKRLRIQHTTLL